jgi:hypothetical protein
MYPLEEFFYIKFSNINIIVHSLLKEDMNKTTTLLMFAAIVAITAVVGTLAIVPAEAQFSNNQQSDQGTCLASCRNAQNAQNFNNNFQNDQD